jgi:hypothetical protein
MGTDEWSRRRFVSGAAGTAMLATLARTLAPAPAAAASRKPTPAGLSDLTGMTLYDPRFANARAVAARLGRGSRYAIHGDATDVALHLAARQRAASGQAPAALRIHGVTTEAVPFCLAALVPGSRLAQRRIDRDLFVWTLEG